MGPVEQLSVILPAVSDLMDRIDHADMHEPTPCTDVVLRDVLDHMVVLGGSFPPTPPGSPTSCPTTWWQRSTPSPGAAITDDLRDGDTFKSPAPAPETATPIERVAAFSGRTV